MSIPQPPSCRVLDDTPSKLSVEVSIKDLDLLARITDLVLEYRDELPEEFIGKLNKIVEEK